MSAWSFDPRDNKIVTAPRNLKRLPKLCSRVLAPQVTMPGSQRTDTQEICKDFVTQYKLQNLSILFFFIILSGGSRSAPAPGNQLCASFRSIAPLLHYVAQRGWALTTSFGGSHGLMYPRSLYPRKSDKMLTIFITRQKSSTF